MAFEFVDELAALLPKVNGTANRARLEHWVYAFGYHRAGGELACLLAVYNEAYTRAMAIKDPTARMAALKTTVVRTAPSLLPVLRLMLSYSGRSQYNGGVSYTLSFACPMVCFHIRFFLSATSVMPHNTSMR